MRKRNFHQDRSSPSPRVWGVWAFLFVYVVLICIKPVSSAKACHRAKVCAPHSSCTKGRGRLASLPCNTRDVGSFRNTVCTLNKGFVSVLFCFAFWFVLISSLRELKVFYLLFPLLYFLYYNCLQYVFCIKCIRVWGCKWNFIHILSKYLL